jgi:hypothetical protein
MANCWKAPEVGLRTAELGGVGGAVGVVGEHAATRRQPNTIDRRIEDAIRTAPCRALVEGSGHHVERG